MPMDSLERDFADIDAMHAFTTRQRRTIELLAILLRIERGERVSLRERWHAKTIVAECPDIAHYAGTTLG